MPLFKKKKFDPESDDYDDETFKKAGMKPDPVTGHGGSLDPRTGMVLKGRKHKTWHLMEEEEHRRGSKVIKGKDGRYYATPAEPY